METTPLPLVNSLRELPLFMGMTSEEMHTVLAHTKLLFKKADAGQVVLSETERSGAIWLLVNGSVSAASRASDGAYTIEETLHAPALIEPGTAFGLRQRFARTYTTTAPCAFIVLEKEEIQLLMDTSLIFRLNLLNLLSTALQKWQSRPFLPQPQAVRGRVVHWLQDRCYTPTGRKVLHIHRLRWAQELHCHPRLLANALHALQADGLLQLKRGQVIVPQMDSLIQN